MFFCYHVVTNISNTNTWWNYILWSIDQQQQQRMQVIFSSKLINTDWDELDRQIGKSIGIYNIIHENIIILLVN